MPTLREVLEAVEGWFDPRWAEEWDAVGLVCGDPAERADRILLAVDAVPATIDEAVRTGAQLLLTHHPLLLTAVHGVPASDPKGALVHRMIRAGIACYVAHTNADVARPGVSDALADLLGLRSLQPLDPMPADPLDKLVVFVPSADASVLIDALAEAGAGRLGDYDRCAWTTTGEGTFRAGAAAQPTIGTIGEVTVVRETRVEMVVPRRVREAVLRTLRHAHPYEEPAFDLLAMADLTTRRGLGRIGELPAALTLAEFAAQAARALPPTTWGIRVAGRPDQLIQTVAVCGGSGASLIAQARVAGADALLTSDLKHHQAVEAVAERGWAEDPPMALLDAAHWATERPFLDRLADRLRERFSTTVEVAVSAEVTDPWTVHVPSTESSPSRS